MHSIQSIEDYRMSKQRRRNSSPADAPAVERKKARKPIHIHADLDYYVVKTNIKCERRVTNGLRDLGIAYYYPNIVVERITKQKKIREERPAFPSYVLVGLPKHNAPFGLVRTVDGVECFLTAPVAVEVAGASYMEQRPFPVPTPLLLAWEDHLSGIGPPSPDLLIGRTFKIGSGSTLAGFMATVLATISDDRVRAEVQMFARRMSVDIPVGDLEAA